MLVHVPMVFMVLRREFSSYKRVTLFQESHLEILLGNTSASDLED